MDELFFTTVIFTSCFFFLSVGVIFMGRPISGSCGRRQGEGPLIINGEEIGIDCLCEATGNPNACSSIGEDELVAAMLRAKEDTGSLDAVSEELQGINESMDDSR